MIRYGVVSQSDIADGCDSQGGEFFIIFGIHENINTILLKFPIFHLVSSPQISTSPDILPPSRDRIREYGGSSG